MPHYFFDLNNGRKIIPDLDGTELPHDDAARAHAAQVARELARNCEQETRSWRLAVRDAEETLRFELLFASADETISRLPPTLGVMFADASGNTALLNEAVLNEAVEQVRVTLLSYENGEGADLASARRRTQRRGLSQR